MEDVDVLGDQYFRFEVQQADASGLGWTERYFFVRARRGVLYEERHLGGGAKALCNLLT